jgi:hypothetical protein
LKQIFLDILNLLTSLNTAWDSTVVYTAGEYTLYSGVIYRSNINSNLNNTPGASTIGTTSLQVWTATDFFIGTGGVPVVPFIGMWNDQVKYWFTGVLTDTQIPAIFVEFKSEDIIVLSQGIESFDPLDIKIHIIDNMLDAGDGTQDQNLRIFDFKQQVYAVLKDFQPTNCVKLFRVFEKQDYDHDNLYHYVQTYRTCYIDNSMQTPVDGTVYGTVGGPPSGFTTTLISLTASAYNPIQSYTLNSIASYDGQLYINITAIGSGGEVWNPAHWELLDTGSVYNPTLSYALNSVVSYDGELYINTTVIGSGGETWNPAHWELINND